MFSKIVCHTLGADCCSSEAEDLHFSGHLDKTPTKAATTRTVQPV